MAVYQPNGAPAAYALSERAEVDKIPLITLGYGRTEATDGTVFPYNFPVMLTFYSEASSLISYIAQREGGFDKVKGKKIATVYHDSAYGRETLGPLKLLAEKYGFENIQITVDHIVGDIWASSSEDVLPAGAAAKGYLALTPYPVGTDFEIHKRLKQYILDKGKSDLKDLKNFGSVYYNSGLVNAAVAVEAIRTAQGKFGKRPLNGEEGRWGLEYLNTDDARLKDMGYFGLMQNLKLSCKDHEGSGSARVQQWDGANWTLIATGSPPTVRCCGR